MRQFRGLDKKAPEEQYAQNYDDGDDDNLDQAHNLILWLRGNVQKS